MKSLATKIAVFGFFALALAGLGRGLEVSTCAMRAAIGSVILFAGVMVAGRIVSRVLADAIARAHKARSSVRGNAGNEQDE